MRWRLMVNTILASCLAVGAVVSGASAAPPSVLDDMISPVSWPTVNEDPRNTTELRPVFAFHRTPAGFVIGKNDVTVVAMQARVALTERFSFIATKDGYTWITPSGATSGVDGALNLGFGFKGSLLQSEEWAAVLSAGIRYETRWGSQNVFQGRGDGVINPFLTGVKGFGPFHVEMYTGPRIPVSGKDSTLYETNLHADYKLPFEVPFVIYPLAELNWQHIVDGGSRYPFNQEGSDLLNLGSSHSVGDVVTLALGARWRLFEWLDVGCTGEFPVSNRHDLFDWRVTSDLIIRPFGFSLPPWPWV